MVYENTREADVTALEKLAAELHSRGYEARITTPDGRQPRLTVTNPAAVILAETVLADAGWYWWPWADRIAAMAEVSTAADVITRVLAVLPGGGQE
jgi:hypothetical protein